MDTPFSVKVQDILMRRQHAASLLYARYGYPNLLVNMPNTLQLMWQLGEGFTREFFALGNWWGAPKQNFAGIDSITTFFFDVDAVTGKRKLNVKAYWAIGGIALILIATTAYFIGRGKKSKT